MAYRVSGTKLLDNGNEFQVFGVNVTGMEGTNGIVLGLWAGLTLDEYIDAIKAQGFNTIRIPIAHATIKGFVIDEGASAASWLEGNAWMKGMLTTNFLDVFIERLERRGMRYYFDIHNLTPDGKIPPYWYHEGFSEADWIWDITTLSSRFKGKKGFIGIDFKNEPDKVTWGDGNLKTDWKAAAERAFKAMDAVNSDLLAIVEWCGCDSPLGLNQMLANPLNIPDDRLVLSPHVYGPSVWKDFGEGFKDPSFPKNMPAVWDRMFGVVAKFKAVIIGEFGGFYIDKDKSWQDAFVAYLKAIGLYNFTYWCWSNDSGDTGGILADGGYRTIRLDKMELLNKLKTDKATFTTDKVIPAVTPIVTPAPAPTPITKNAFKAGDIVKLKTGEGPKLIVMGYEGAQLNAFYWSPVDGFLFEAFPNDQTFKIV